MMLVVDPWDWLRKDGSLPLGNPGLRRNTLRVARVIEYGGPLPTGQYRQTLIECRRRPNRRPCGGLLSVVKLPDETLLATCPQCMTDQMLVHNWSETKWAAGPQPGRRWVP